MCGVGLCLGLAGRAATVYPQGTAFPLEVYEADGREMAGLAAHGWNILQSYGMGTADDNDRYLRKLAGLPVNGLIVVPCNGHGTNKMEWPAERVQAWVQDVGTNPNVAWWDLPEEVRPWRAPEMRMVADYTAATRRFDPLRRPTYEYTPNHRDGPTVARTITNVDVVGLSCYCEATHMPHAWVRYKVQEAGIHAIKLAGATVGPDYLHGQKTPVAILYCAQDKKGDAIATPEQSYHDFWSAVVSGARGIGVYSYFHSQRDNPGLAKNWERFNAAASELSGPEKIGEAVLWGETVSEVGFEIVSGPAQTVAFRPSAEKHDFQYPSINVLAKAKDGKLLVMAVNSTDQTVVARITGLPAGEAVLPFEGRSVAVKDGGMTETFAPWGVHVYKMAR